MAATIAGHATQVQLVAVLLCCADRRVDVGRCMCAHLFDGDLSVVHDEIHELVWFGFAATLRMCSHL